MKHYKWPDNVIELENKIIKLIGNLIIPIKNIICLLCLEFQLALKIHLQ